MILTEKLRATEVAALIGSSVNAINVWYKFKKENPENELSKLLPDYKMESLNKGRFWNKEDIWKLIEFKSKIKKGRNGQLSSVYQRYRKDKKKGK